MRFSWKGTLRCTIEIKIAWIVQFVSQVNAFAGIELTVRGKLIVAVRKRKSGVTT